MDAASLFFHGLPVDEIQIFSAQLGQLVQEALLFLGQIVRGFHLNLDEQIAEPSAFQVLDPPAFQPENLAGLRAGGNLELLGAFEGGNLDGNAESGLDERDRNFAIQMILLAHEEIVLHDLDGDVEISPAPVLVSGLPLPLDAEPGSVIDTRRDADIQRFFLPDVAGPAAFIAGRGDDLSAPSALRTSPG